MISQPERAAFATLAEWLDRKSTSPQQCDPLPGEAREILLAFAETHISRRIGRSDVSLASVAFARVQALFIAAAFATLDYEAGEGAAPPFVHHELRAAYREQIRYLTSGSAPTAAGR